MRGCSLALPGALLNRKSGRGSCGPVGPVTGRG